MSTETHPQANSTLASADRALGARPERPAPTVVDMGILSRSLAFHVRKAQLALQRRGLRNVAPANVGPAEFGTLVLCEQNPGLAQFQIAAALDIDKASVVAVVDRLEELGWLVRRRSNTDRRRYGLFLTPTGAHQTGVLRSQSEQAESFAQELFSGAELQQLLALLGRLA
ncbi:MAG TPA: MarR family winged helix-turn-helix transcriptional regulator [Steroidobacteraceae bacterium]|nr:MarR family winged helix-turn-helix transcriptional regulator [Steroidobacteraceae bacterium]